MENNEVPKERGDKRYIHIIRQRVWKTIKKHALFAPDDRILIGLSGGKDSLVLVDCLSFINRVFCQQWNLRAVFVDIPGVGYRSDRAYLEEFCRYRNVEFTFAQIGVPFDPNHRKGPCFVCSWHRRKTLFGISREENYPRLALGHHMDDAIETLLLNMIFHASISSLPAALSMFGGRMHLVRPLLFLSEAELSRYASETGITPQVKNCPYGDDTRRSAVKEIIAQTDRMNRGARVNLFRCMSHICEEYLPSADATGKANPV